MANQSIEVEIITPTQSVFHGNADMVTIPGAVSEFQVLNDHSPIVASLAPGVIKIELNGQITKFAVSGGLAEVRDNFVSILAPIAVSPENIDSDAVNSKLKEDKAKILTKLSDTELELTQSEIKFLEAQIRSIKN